MIRNILNRLLRLIIGLFLFTTLIFTIVPSLIIWVIIGRFFLLEIAEWTITNEYPE